MLWMFGSALIGQVVLSAASFGVGLLLIRFGSERQYGYYVLVTGAIILAVSLQNAFIAPAMISRMTTLGRRGCGALTGGLYREQRQLSLVVGGLSLLGVLLLWQSGLIGRDLALLGVTATLAMLLALQREYFRMVLLAYRHADRVLRGDVVYVVVLLAGVLLAVQGPAGIVAAVAALALAGAALVASLRLSRSLRRVEPWDLKGVPGILRQIAPLGAWSTAGAAIHWSFSQGYGVLAAVTLDIHAVAAIAATRMLAMPVTLLATGIGSLMLPLTARWLVDHGARWVLRRLLWIAGVMALISMAYFGLLWLTRDWVFDVLIRKRFADGDALLLLWSASFVMMAVHQQLLWLLIARARFHALTLLALVSAVVAIVSSYLGMRHFGVIGAPMGILFGETLNVLGVVLLCQRELRRDAQAPRVEGPHRGEPPRAASDHPELAEVIL